MKRARRCDVQQTPVYTAPVIGFEITWPAGDHLHLLAHQVRLLDVGAPYRDPNLQLQNV